MAERKYAVPGFIGTFFDQSDYDRWLSRKASALLRRDRGRGNTCATRADYKKAIHQAVLDSKGLDAYTGEMLSWNLLRQYDNVESKKHGRKYKARFAMLPTVDHVGDGKGPASFKICSWKVNDAKNDLSLNEFLDLCRSVLKHHATRPFATRRAL